MKMKTYQYFALFLTLIISNAYGNVEINKMDFSKAKNKGVITVHFTGNLNDYPELTVTGKSIQVVIPNSKVKKSIEKSVSFSSNLKDTQLRAYQSTKNSSKIKALLPFMIQKKKDQVALTIKDNKIELTFPRVMVKLNKSPKFGSILKKKKTKVKKEFLNEAYLNNLLKVDPKKADKKIAKNPTSIFHPKKSEKVDSDTVKTTLASPSLINKKGKSSISLIEYGGKFVAFLGLVLLLFYGVITLMKKGFIKKGKLGFLNNADQISVINQTYIGPKKSLMLIKAHNQVFLVSNTDQGIHAISEIKDAAGLLKDGEIALSGHNFDSNLGEANDDELNDKKITLKDDITQSNQQSSLSSYTNVKEKVSFSDQLKKKVKNLKPLH
ncbi:MAG: flagellar biogenesis protein FliO/sulfur relay (sulfurtransferase) DsrC/TusE family protein [Bacteriovoracaceae bacterium]|jgi:flagellar biogenesis protein FliO/sulfur relay (sulfurtransferase) DsrC/TusE family protein